MPRNAYVRTCISIETMKNIKTMKSNINEYLKIRMSTNIETHENKLHHSICPLKRKDDNIQPWLKKSLKIPKGQSESVNR